MRLYFLLGFIFLLGACTSKKQTETKSDLVATTIDLLPTIAEIADVDKPTDRVIDGLDISDIIHGKSNELERPYFYCQHQELRAVRLGKWKLHLAHPSAGRTEFNKSLMIHIAPEDRVFFDKNVLYNLDKDIAETTDVSDVNPEVVAELFLKKMNSNLKF